MSSRLVWSQRGGLPSVWLSSARHHDCQDHVLVLQVWRLVNGLRRLIVGPLPMLQAYRSVSLDVQPRQSTF